MANWMARMMKLPEDFHFPDDLRQRDSKRGGGIIYGSGSEANYTAILAAKAKMEKKIGKRDTNFVIYASRHAHFSVPTGNAYCAQLCLTK